MVSQGHVVVRGCRVDPVIVHRGGAFSLVGRLALHPGADPAALPPDLRLVLQRRDGLERGLEAVLDPARPSGKGGPPGPAFEVLLDPASVDLPPGTWDLYVELSGTDPQRTRVAAGDVIPPDGRTSVEPWAGAPAVPYVTVYGNLSLRVRKPGGHLEVEEVWVHAGRVSVLARLAEAAEGLAAPETLLARRQADGAEVEVPVSGSSDRLEAVLDLRSVVDADDDTGVWEVVARTAGSDTEVPVGRYLDDIRNKPSVFVYPELTVDGNGRRRSAGPAFTSDEQFAIVVREAA